MSGYSTLSTTPAPPCQRRGELLSCYSSPPFFKEGAGGGFCGLLAKSFNFKLLKLRKVELSSRF